jgi:hypothetical protein
MARPRRVNPVKMFVGLLGGDPDLLLRARQLLQRQWGAVDLESDRWPFDQTDYYTESMGPGLQRWFLGFEQLTHPGHLATIKHETNALEELIADDCLLSEIARPVNIDPGYVDLRKLVLATTKDAGHRIYIGHNMYAEVTLQYAHGGWQTYPWTYPDYASGHYHDFFSRLRERYRQQLNAIANQAGSAAENDP